jgi:hypothetical protein
MPDMILDQALDIMEQYAVDRDLDSLSGVEHMVKHLKTLSTDQRKALTVFMQESRTIGD